MTWETLLAPWRQEPALVEESEFTPWADPGWLAWNQHAVEYQIAEFIGKLVPVIGPSRVIETGVGQGFITRRYQTHRMLFESDDAWRYQLQGICDIDGRPTFTAAEIRHTDFTILDSNFPIRFAELFLWFDQAKEGAWLFVHDTGTKHPAGTAYQVLHGMVASLGLPGFWLDNPRGAWIGRKRAPVSDRIRDLWIGLHP